VGASQIKAAQYGGKHTARGKKQAEKTWFLR
jgi:hypothetical protein